MASLKGRYTPKNPQKYKGDPTRVYYRSSWELKVMNYLDRKSNVIEWSSEEFWIPYRDPVDGRQRRYFPDFWVRVQDENLQVSTWILEVKPKSQTPAHPPKPRKRKTRRYIREVETHLRNKRKFESAHKYAMKKGWNWRVLTEDDIWQ